MFAVVAFKIKVSIILKMIQRKNQFTKQINRFVSQELCYYSAGFDKKIVFGPEKVTGTFEERASGLSADFAADFGAGFSADFGTCRRLSFWCMFWCRF